MASSDAPEELRRTESLENGGGWGRGQAKGVLPWRRHPDQRWCRPLPACAVRQARCGKLTTLPPSAFACAISPSCSI